MTRILIIDNNEHIAGLFKEVLTREGHKVTVAETGRAAMQLIDNNEFDIAFIDLELPDINGLNILCHIKRNFPDIVASIITGKSEINSAVEAIKAGVFRYLKKPFDLDDIHEVTRLSVEENKKRKSAKAGIKSNLSFEHLATLLPDLLMLIPALFMGFIIQQRLYHWQHIPIIWGPGEVIYMLSSFACCYSFIFFSSYGYRLRDSKAGMIELYKPYIGAYVLYAAILFFVTDFIYGRLVLISGFAFGLAGLHLSRNFVLPNARMLLTRKQEGPRKIVLKNLGGKFGPVRERPETKTAGIAEQKPAGYHGSPARDKNPMKPAFYQLRENSDLGNDWGSRLILEFRKSRLKNSRCNIDEKVETMK